LVSNALNASRHAVASRVRGMGGKKRRSGLTGHRFGGKIRRKEETFNHGVLGGGYARHKRGCKNRTPSVA
jgi:hypothetical protein